MFLQAAPAISLGDEFPHAGIRPASSFSSRPIRVAVQQPQRDELFSNPRVLVPALRAAAARRAHQVVAALGTLRSAPVLGVANCRPPTEPPPSSNQSHCHRRTRQAGRPGKPKRAEQSARRDRNRDDDEGDSSDRPAGGFQGILDSGFITPTASATIMANGGTSPRAATQPRARRRRCAR